MKVCVCACPVSYVREFRLSEIRVYGQRKESPFFLCGGRARRALTRRGLWRGRARSLVARRLGERAAIDRVSTWRPLAGVSRTRTRPATDLSLAQEHVSHGSALLSLLVWALHGTHDPWQWWCSADQVAERNQVSYSKAKGKGADLAVEGVDCTTQDSYVGRRSLV